MDPAALKKLSREEKYVKLRRGVIGPTTADVKLGGSAVPNTGVPVLGPTPTVGDTVNVLVQGNQMLILTSGGGAGSPGPAGSVWHWANTSGAPDPLLGIVGDWALTNDGDVYEKIGGGGGWTLRDNLTGPQGAQGNQGIQGPQGNVGNTGATGPAGRPSGFPYTFSTLTAEADPGSGKFRFNAAAVLATSLYISETDADGNGLVGWMDTWDDSTSTVRGYLHIALASSPRFFYLYSVTGTRTDNGTWDTFTVARVAGDGPLQDGDSCIISFWRTGDKGEQGTQGIQGPQGTAGAGADTFPCQFRLSLVSGDAMPVADQTAKATLYAVPYGGNRISLWNGSAWVVHTPTERSLALGTLTSGLNYDVFAYDNAGTVTLELLAWTSDTARAMALTTQDGVLVKSGAATRRYLGTIRTTATTTTEDSAAKRFVWNYYNRVARRLYTVPGYNNNNALTSFTYTSTNWGAVNGGTGSQIGIVIGVSEDEIQARIQALVGNSTNAARIALGVDSTSNPASMGHKDASATNHQIATSWNDQLAAGYHALNFLAQTDAGTMTIYVDLRIGGATADTPVSFMSGRVFA